MFFVKYRSLMLACQKGLIPEIFFLIAFVTYRYYNHKKRAKNPLNSKGIG